MAALWMSFIGLGISVSSLLFFFFVSYDVLRLCHCRMRQRRASGLFINAVLWEGSHVSEH